MFKFHGFMGSFSHQAELGRKLAEMHKAGKSSKGFGFEVDNTIGRFEKKYTFPLSEFECNVCAHVLVPHR